jgi:hypothetical protein
VCFEAATGNEALERAASESEQYTADSKLEVFPEWRGYEQDGERSSTDTRCGRRSSKQRCLSKSSTPRATRSSTTIPIRCFASSTSWRSARYER